MPERTSTRGAWDTGAAGQRSADYAGRVGADNRPGARV